VREREREKGREKKGTRERPEIGEGRHRCHHQHHRSNRANAEGDIVTPDLLRKVGEFRKNQGNGKRETQKHRNTEIETARMREIRRERKGCSTVSGTNLPRSPE